MSAKSDTILITRYASRRLYNTDTSDYVTLEEVADLVRHGKDVQIVDRKTGEDLTRQYLLQIITEHEARGENILPISVLMDIVRSYGEATESIIPDFLARSYETLKEQQLAVMEQFQSSVPQVFDPASMFGDPMEWQKKQSELLGSIMAPFMPDMQTSANAAEEQPAKKSTAKKASRKAEPKLKEEQVSTSEVEDIKQQLADLQDKLSKL
ncbi:MAG: polyhydroxyalkanoate synthesis repressor PhaR [bacterium]|nr:polyhydroxyalkanoate synthesis repressor PhaR [bacterium]